MFYFSQRSYCAFYKHANSKVQKPPLQLPFSLPSIIITITSNEPWNTETQKHRKPITNHKPWPFETVKVKVCFLKGPLRWLTAAKNAIVSWLLNFRIRMSVKSAVSWKRRNRRVSRSGGYKSIQVMMKQFTRVAIIKIMFEVNAKKTRTHSLLDGFY